MIYIVSAPSQWKQYVAIFFFAEIGKMFLKHTWKDKGTQSKWSFKKQRKLTGFTQTGKLEAENIGHFPGAAGAQGLNTGRCG